MRDVLALGMIGIGAALALFYPWLGIMAWTTISIMNPHRYSWALRIFRWRRRDGRNAWPPSSIITRPGSDFGHTDRRRVRRIRAVDVHHPSVSLYYQGSFGMWKQVMKIDFMIFLAVMILHTRKHIMALVWVLVASIGLYGSRAAFS